MLTSQLTVTTYEALHNKDKGLSDIQQPLYNQRNILQQIYNIIKNRSTIQNSDICNIKFHYEDIR